MLFRIKLLIVAMLYGASLMAAISNTLMLAVYLSSGRAVGSALPIALMGWGIILFLHKRMGWPPFSGPAAPDIYVEGKRIGGINGSAGAAPGRSI